jgi:hypothetical protein
MRLPLWFAIGRELPDVQQWTLSLDQHGQKWQTSLASRQRPANLWAPCSAWSGQLSRSAGSCASLGPRRRWGSAASSSTTRRRSYCEHRKAQLRLRLRAGNAWQDYDLVFRQDDGRPWNPDHVSKRFKKLAAQAGVPVVTLHEGGRHTGNSLMRDAGVDQELRMREVGHSDRSVNDRYTHPLEQAHLAASEQTAALVRKAGKAS